MIGYLLFLFLFIVLSNGTLLTRYNLTEYSPLAVCNDGSPAVYYFSPGSGVGVNTWVIRLMGGGWCYDVESCRHRAESEPSLVSSKGCTEQFNVEGILSSEPAQNPYFYNANRVYLWYCSSDSHLGTRGANTTITGWHYQGKAGVEALISSLFKSRVPSLHDAKHVLVTGDSAGGVGAMNNADYIYSLISPVLPNINYRVFVDAGFFLDIPAYNDTDFSFQLVAKNLFNYWGAVYDESCMKFYGPGNEWHCFHGQYAWPHLEALAFYQEFQFDKANLDMDFIRYPFNPPMKNFTENFQKTMITSMAKVPYFFLPNCYKHESIDSSLFVTVKIGETTIARAVWEWFNKSSLSPVSPSRTIDGCTSFNCNPTCPPIS